MKIIKRIFRIFAIFLLILIIGFIFYTMDYEKAEQELETYISNSSVEMIDEDGIIIIDGDKDNETAIIFYPGGKVEYIAYLPLLEDIASLGYDCYLVEFPFNLAVLDSDKAEQVLKIYDADNWYLMGHSLGGAMASRYIADSDIFNGLILLGSYPASDLSDTELDILQLNGSLDTVLNRERADDAEKYFNNSSVVYEIDGGNHSGFGDYGLQDGDTEALLSPEQQRKITAEKINEMMGK